MSFELKKVFLYIYNHFTRSSSVSAGLGNDPFIPDKYWEEEFARHCARAMAAKEAEQCALPLTRESRVLASSVGGPGFPLQ